MAITDRKVHYAALHARQFIQYVNAAVPINQAGVRFLSVVPYQGIVVPYAIYGYQVDNVQVWCTATAATVTVDAQVNGVTVLTGGIVPVAGAVTPGVLVASVVARRGRLIDPLAIVITSNGTGTITNAVVTVTFRPFPLDNEAA